MKVTTGTYLSVNAKQKRIDPTRTITLQRAYEKDMVRRFNNIAKRIRTAILEKDIFGLQNPTVNIDPGFNAFNFPTNSAKIQAFMKWLNSMMEQELLQVSSGQQVGTAIHSQWQNMYLYDSYKRGTQRARYELTKAGYPIPTDIQSGGINAILSTPVHMDRLGMTYIRAYNELNGITNDMGKLMSKVLTDGMASGDGALDIANKLQAVMKGGGHELGLTDSLGRFIPAERRARMLARTEIVRAHHKATIQEYRNYAAEGIYVKAEWVAGTDDRVCERCLKMERDEQGELILYTLDEIENLLPLHPNCRCTTVPVPVDEVPEKGKPVDVVKDSLAERIKNDPVASTFTNPEDAKKYLELKDKYDEFFKTIPQETKDLLVKIAGADKFDGNYATWIRSKEYFNFTQSIKEFDPAWSLGGIEQVILRWTEATHQTMPMSLKYWDAHLTGKEMKYPAKWLGMGMKFVDNFEQAVLNGEYLKKDDFLKIRALNQSYMESIGVKEMQLYRGTTGRTGMEYAKYLSNNPDITHIEIKDATVAGYSSDKGLADTFGYEPGGITVSRLVPASEIVWHKDLFSSFLNQWSSFNEEMEVLVSSGTRTIPVSQITYYKYVEQ